MHEAEGDGGLITAMGDDAVLGKEFWRRPVEILTRELVFTRRLPERFGGRRIYVSPKCELRILKWWTSPFSVELLRAADLLVGESETVWDIGANHGVFAVAAAHRSRATVLAVEPDPFIAGLLRKTLALPENQDLRIDALQAAISDGDGIGRLNVNARGRAMNNLAGKSIWSDYRSREEVVPVATLALDTLLDSAGTPALVKADIEGAEHVMLRGAAHLLRDARPVLFVEVADRNAAEISARLTAQRYRVFDGDSLDRGLVEGGVYDWLCIPEEKLARYRARIAEAQAGGA